MDKAHQTAADLDVARCHGNWPAIPDLARRYKKYHPSETVLDTTACVEVDLVQQLQRVRRNEQKTPSTDDEKQPPSSPLQQYYWPGEDTAYQNDTPDHISLPPRLSQVHSQPLERRLIKVISNKSADALETPDDWQSQFAKIILARVYFESARYPQALETLQNLALRAEDVSAGYGLVLLVQARAIKGICFEMQNDISSALEAFEAAWQVVKTHPGERCETLALWIEECLYRAILLHLRARSDTGRTLTMMRAYVQLALSPWATHWQRHKQWVILRAYTHYLIRTTQTRSYVLPENTTSIKEQAAIEELAVVMTAYRQLLRLITPQLTTRALNSHVVELADLMNRAHAEIGWGDRSNVRNALKFLYQAKETTFNSPCISRHLLFVLLRLGHFDEAKHCFKAYMGLIGVNNLDHVAESDVVEQKETEARANSIRRKFTILHELDAQGDEALALDEEGWVDIVHALLAGVELHGRELGDGKTASALADLAVELAEKEDPLLLAACFRARGTAYGLWAEQSTDPDHRSSHHSKSIASLRRAIELDPNQWKSHYELAVQLAVTRDTAAAATAVLRAIQLKRDFLPAWHLLALIYSSNNHLQQVPQALQTIEAGLKQVDIADIPSDRDATISYVTWDDNEPSRRQYFETAQSYLSMRMTQLLVLEQLEGTEATMDLYADLFGIYAKLSQHFGLDANEMAVATPAGSSTLADEEEYFENGGSSSTLSSIRRRSSLTRSRSRSRSLSERRRSNSIGSRRPSDSAKSTFSVMADAPLQQDDPPPGKLKPSSSDETRSDRRSATSQRLPRRNSQKSLRIKSLQLMDIGFARRIGGGSQGSGSSATMNGTSSPVVMGNDRRTSANTESSLASLLTPTSRTTMHHKKPFAPTVSLFKENPFVANCRETWHQLLIKLWLMSTATFIKTARLDEAIKAVMEAEQQLLVGQVNDASVWHQLGVVCVHKGGDELLRTGMDAFNKALAIDPDHVETLVSAAQLHIDQGEWELAETYLDRTTQGYGWHHARAWYLLGHCYRHHGALARAKECFLYALELDDTCPLQPFSVLPRFV